MFEKVIVSNSDAIQKLKSEIVELKGEENPAEVSATFEWKGINQKDNLMKEIIEKPQTADKTINANSEKIKRIGSEIDNIALSFHEWWVLISLLTDSIFYCSCRSCNCYIEYKIELSNVI